MNITREHATALTATAVGTLTAFLFLHAGASIFDIAGAAVIAYAVTVAVAVWKIKRLSLFKVITSTGRGTVIGCVITVIILIGFYRAIRGL